MPQSIKLPQASNPPACLKETGQISVLAAVGISALIALLLLFSALGAGAGSKAQAQNVADFAALAAAKAHFYETGLQPCGQAEKIAEQNRATLVSCKIGTKQVEVTISSRIWSPSWLGQAEAKARAGPVKMD